MFLSNGFRYGFNGMEKDDVASDDGVESISEGVNNILHGKMNVDTILDRYGKAKRRVKINGKLINDSKKF